MQRVIEIADRAVHLALSRGFMVVKEGGDEVARIPLDDIVCLLLTGQQASLSTAVLHAMMERNISVVIVGHNYHPSGILLPTAGHFASKQRLDWQIEATEPFKKRIWQQIVQAKIRHQAEVLLRHTGGHHGLAPMSARVGSGDSQNREAQASRIYWPKLFGVKFRRHADDAVNAALNYGYAVVRACVARQIVACGLHPALGVHHDNIENPFCLADDIIEPFRPFVDDLVFGLNCDGLFELTPQIKKELAAILTLDVMVEYQTSILSNAVLTCCQSLARAFETKEPQIILPQFAEN